MATTVGRKKLQQGRRSKKTTAGTMGEMLLRGEEEEEVIQKVAGVRTVGARE